MKSQMLGRMKKQKAAFIGIAVTTFLTMCQISADAQTADGNAGINQATTQVKSYFATGTNLMYAIGAIVGLVGAIKVFKKWNDGEHDTGKVASSWFGSCILGC